MLLTFQVTLNVASQAHSEYNGAKTMEFGSLHGGEDGEYNDIDFVELSKIFPMQEHLIENSTHDLSDTIPLSISCLSVIHVCIYQFSNAAGPSSSCIQVFNSLCCYLVYDQC